MSGVTDKLLAGAQAAAQGDLTAPARLAEELREKHLAALKDLAPGNTAVEKIIADYVSEFLALCHAMGVLGEASPRALDAIGSLGERMSAPLVAAALTQAGLPAQAVDAADCVLTDAVYQSASPAMDVTTEHIESSSQSWRRPRPRHHRLLQPRRVW
jgi:aspartate kinase